jgi:intracellular sulfur oxidation DsrE/DsrF family protein
MIMRSKIMLLLYLIAVISLYAVSPASAEEYRALNGVRSVKAVFDERIGDPQIASSHLKLIHQTYKQLSALKKSPAVAVVFIGPSVKLISKNREGFSAEQQKSLDAIAETVSEMSRDGIRLEVCLVAAKAFHVDPASILPEIKRSENGFISLIGYQSQGYSLVPDY